MRLKKIFTQLTGYWIHKKITLPIGSDLFYDICERLGYGELKIVFDVGANLGQTVKWIRHNQPNTKIYCFEPVSSVYNKLKENLYLLDNNIIPEQIAFSNERGHKRIRLFSEHTVLNSLRDDLMNQDVNAIEEVVVVETLDSYCRNRNIDSIDLLKIDTEGYELCVLKGAMDMILDRKIKFIYCEAGFNRSNARNTYFPDICDFLSEKGYYFYSFYQISDQYWRSGNNYANALFIHSSI